MTIRSAHSTDICVLSALGRKTFSDTFAHLYDPADLAAYLDDQQSEEWYARALDDPERALWIAEKDSVAVGYAVAGANHLPIEEDEPRAGEIQRLYLLKEAQGAGIGTALVRTMIDWLAARGHDPLYVGVWSENFGAQALYGRYGFEKVADYLFPVGEARDLEFILKRPPRA